MLKYALSLILTITMSCSAAFACPHEEKPYDGKLDVKTLKEQSITDNKAPIVYPVTSKPLVTTLRINIPPGVETGWHLHPYPGYAYIISGTTETTMENGKKQHYETGQAVYEVVTPPHNGRCVSESPCELMATFTGAENEPVTVMLPGHDG